MPVPAHPARPPGPLLHPPSASSSSGRHCLPQLRPPLLLLSCRRASLRLPGELRLLSPLPSRLAAPIAIMLVGAEFAAVDVLVGASPPTSPVSHRALPSPSLLLPPCPLPLCSIPSLLCLHLLFLPVRCLIKCQFKRLMQPRPLEHHDRVCDLVSAPPPSTTSSATASIKVSSSMDHFQAVGAILCHLFKLCCLEL